MSLIVPMPLALRQLYERPWFIWPVNDPEEHYSRPVKVIRGRSLRSMIEKASRDRFWATMAKDDGYAHLYWHPSDRDGILVSLLPWWFIRWFSGNRWRVCNSIGHSPKEYPNMDALWPDVVCEYCGYEFQTS